MPRDKDPALFSARAFVNCRLSFAAECRVRVLGGFTQCGTGAASAEGQAGRQVLGAGPRSGMQHPTSQLGKDAESFENAEEGRRGKSAAKIKYSLAHVPLFVSIFSHFTQLVRFGQHSLTSTLLTVTFYVGNESRSW